jgi:hypothetical protein
MEEMANTSAESDPGMLKCPAFRRSDNPRGRSFTEFLRHTFMGTISPAHPATRYLTFTRVISYECPIQVGATGYPAVYGPVLSNQARDC